MDGYFAEAGGQTKNSHKNDENRDDVENDNEDVDKFVFKNLYTMGF